MSGTHHCLTVQVTKAFVARLDAAAERVAAEYPGLTPTRTMIVRAVLTRWLDEHEAEQSAQKPAVRRRRRA